MKINDPKITILVNGEFTTIELHDGSSSLQILEVRLTPQQLSDVLSRRSHTPCEAQIMNTDRVNKIHENKEFEFEIPDGVTWSTYKNETEDLYQAAINACPDGWKPDNYFSRQNTFSTRDGKQYCTVTIRRWI